MAVFVLVHGAFHGGWCWQRLTPLLRAAGHEVYTPTLSGLGDRRHLVHPRITALTHAEDVVNLFYFEDLRDVVLVGHSYAGVVIAKAAESLAERLRRLVFLDAVVIHHSEIYFEARTREMREGAQRGAREQGFGWLMPPRPVADFGITVPADVAWVEPRLTPQPLATMSESIDLRRFYELTTPRTYIHCRRYGLAAHADRASALGWQRIDLDAEHDLMITEPQRLARVLLDLERT